MKEFTLYKHQNKLVKNVKKAWKDGFLRVLAQSPTGSGKTVMFSFVASQVSENNKKVLIITDRTELLGQTGGTIEAFKMNPYYITAGTKYIDRTKTVYIAMAQTLRNRLDIPMWRDFIKNHIGLIVIDECHVQEFNYLFEDEDLIKGKFVLGFTATPSRSGKMKQLGLQYEKIVSGEPIKKLIKKGYLVNCDTYDCGVPDLKGVAMNRAKGDYAEGAMYQKFDNPKLYKGLVKNYLKFTPHEKMIVFCCNVEHAIKTTKALNKAGVSAKFIAAKKTAPREPRKWTSASEAIFKDKFKSFKLYAKNFDKYSGDRKKIFEGFKTGEFEVLVNVGIATKGFDDPTITVVALYRATTSLELYLQMIGRGSRIAPQIEKTHFTVLDFGGNKERFGPYDIDREWSLWHEEVQSGGIPPMKICGGDTEKIKGAGDVKKGCERLILASYQICPFCGFKYPKRDKAKEIDLELAAIVDEKGVSIKSKAFKDMSFEELYKYREIKKHHINWVCRLLWIRGGEESIRDYGKQFGWKPAFIKRTIKHCESKYKKNVQKVL